MTARGWSLRGRLSRNVLLVAGAGWLAGLMLGVLVLDHEMQEVLDEGLRSEARLVLAVMGRRWKAMNRICCCGCCRQGAPPRLPPGQS